MEVLLIMLMMPLSVFVERTFDPSPGLGQSREDARNLECQRLSQAEAHRRYPARVPDLPARGTWVVSDALACTTRYLRWGERQPRDEQVLGTLRGTVAGITEVAAARAPTGTTWHVDAFYPDPRVAQKIAVAARTELAERRNRVSDRVPLLAAGDLAILGRLAAKDAYPLACKRYFAQGVLEEREAFLGLMIVDPRETVLHAGICLDGKWTWLQ